MNTNPTIAMLRRALARQRRLLTRARNALLQELAASAPWTDHPQLREHARIVDRIDTELAKETP